MVDFSKAHFCFLRSSWLGNRIFVSLGKSLFVFWQATRTRTKQPEPNKRNGSYLNAKRRSIFGSSNNVSPWWYFFANVCGMGSGGYRCQDECSNLVFRDGSQSPVVFFFFFRFRNWEKDSQTLQTKKSQLGLPLVDTEVPVG